MRRMRGLCPRALGVWMILCSNALAAGPMSIEEAVDQALANHPSLKTAEARVQQAKAAHRALWDGYAPQVTAFAGLQRNQLNGSATTTTTPGFLGSTTTINRSFSQSDTETVAGGNVEEFLFDFGSFSGQRRAADERASAQKEALSTQRLDVALNVKVAYYNLLLANRLLQYNQDAAEQRRARLAQIVALEKNDPGRRKDLLQAELDLANARLNLAKSESDIGEAEATFSDALGEESRSPHSLVDDVTLKINLLDLDQAVSRALNSRPELGQIEAIVRAQQGEVDATWASYLPRFSAFAGVVSLTPTGSAGFDQLTVLSGGLKIGMPLTLLVSTDRLRQAEAGLDEAKARERETRQVITLAVSRSYNALSEAVARIRITEELANRANQNWDETQARYRRGVATIVESTTAYAFLYDARVSLIRTLYEAKLAEARLERAIGADF